jgi:hypothetical protein
MRMSKMIEPQNAFEIFNLLEKSNCGEKTCLASIPFIGPFIATVFPTLVAISRFES